MLAPGHDDDRAGPARPARVLAGRRAAERADGRRCRCGEANLAVGNPAGRPALEITLRRADPAVLRRRRRLRHRRAVPRSTLDGEPVAAVGAARRCPPAACSRSARPPGPGCGSLPRGARRPRRAALPRQRLDLHARRLRRPRRPGAGRRRRAAAGSPDSAARMTPPTARVGGRRPATGARISRDVGARRHRGPARRARLLHPRRHRRRCTRPTTRCTSTRRAPACG